MRWNCTGCRFDIGAFAVHRLHTHTLWCHCTGSILDVDILIKWHRPALCDDVKLDLILINVCFKLRLPISRAGMVLDNFCLQWFFNHEPSTYTSRQRHAESTQLRGSRNSATQRLQTTMQTPRPNLGALGTRTLMHHVGIQMSACET